VQFTIGIQFWYPQPKPPTQSKIKTLSNSPDRRAPYYVRASQSVTQRLPGGMQNNISRHGVNYVISIFCQAYLASEMVRIKNCSVYTLFHYS